MTVSRGQTDSYVMDRFSEEIPARSGQLWSKIEDETLTKEFSTAVHLLSLSHRRTVYSILHRVRDLALIKKLEGRTIHDRPF